MWVDPSGQTLLPLYLLVHFYLLLLKLYSLNSVDCTCIDVIAVGRFIPRNESALYRDQQVAQSPLGSSALRLV